MTTITMIRCDGSLTTRAMFPRNSRGNIEAKAEAVLRMRYMAMKFLSVGERPKLMAQARCLSGEPLEF